MIGIISDVHGNYHALKSVLSAINSFDCKKIISLGDVAGYYCMINECIELLINNNVINILGNHDDYLINNRSCPRSYTANYCLDYQREIITTSNLNWLKSSLSHYDKNGISARHGGWADFLDEYVDNFDFSVATRINANCFISGHTHIQKINFSNDIVYLNPGSVGQPRDGNPMAAYAIIDDNLNIWLKRISYDIDAVVAKMEKEGFEKRISNCLYKGVKINGHE